MTPHLLWCWILIFWERDLRNAKALKPVFLRCKGENNKLKYTRIIKESSQLYNVWAQEVSEPNAEFSYQRILDRPSNRASKQDRQREMSQCGPFLPPAEHTSSGWDKMLGRNLQVLVKVITLVSLHLICSLTDFQTVEWVNKVLQGTPAGDGLPQGCTHKRSWNPTTRCEPQTKA